MDTATSSAPLLPSGWLEERTGEEPLARYRTALEVIGCSLAEQFANGAPANELVRRRSDALDTVLGSAWQPRSEQLAGLGIASALVAVGGFGRGELHPGSDIDILILLDRPLASAPQPGEHSGGESGSDDDAEARAELEAFVTLLWDIGLDVGQSVRTVAECGSTAREDVTIATNLMESRLISGEPELFEAMRRLTGPDHVWPTAAFFEAKRSEQEARHRRYNGTGYNLEPNIKEGPGGLRDIQMIGWVVKRHYGAETLADLVTHGFLTEKECQTLEAGQDFLWQVRMALHLKAGRREDRLLFDMQRDIAAQFGYRDLEHNLGVEQFMHRYYRTITELTRLNEMLLALFQELLLGSESEPTIVAVNRRFQIRNGFLEVTHPNVFKRYPFALLELFLILQQNPQVEGVRASTIRLVRDHRYLIDEEFRQDLGCRSLFLEIIRQPRGQTHEFRRMHNYGVLEAYLPVFGRIVGLMQFDLFHVYTVDEHILFTVRNLRQFMVPEHYHELPHCSDIIPRLPKPELLYVAGLFHDIAKGRGGDHSTSGAEEVIGFCQHHGISSYDAQLLAWLVRNHLLMSTTAQRQDTSDPEVVRKFATEVGDTTRLDYLYLLTVADIRATNPEVWNDWKDALLRDLLAKTRRMLRRGLDNPVASTELGRECRAAALVELELVGIDAPAAQALWSHHGEDYLVRTRPEDVSWHTQVVLAHERGPDRERLPVVAVNTTERGTDVFIYCDDRDYLFAASATILERLGLTVLDARIFTDERGMTYDSYTVLEADGMSIGSEVRRAEIRDALVARLQDPGKAIYPTSRVPRRQLKSFAIEPRVHFERDQRHDRSIVEVISADRPGLLSRIGWALVSCGASLRSAKVSTLGERAEDLFFVTGRDGHALSDEACATLRERIIDALHSGEPGEPDAQGQHEQSIVGTDEVTDRHLDSPAEPSGSSRAP